MKERERVQIVRGSLRVSVDERVRERRIVSISFQNNPIEAGDR